MPRVQLIACQSYDRDELKPILDSALSRWSTALPSSGSKLLLKPNMVKAVPREAQAQTDPVFIATLAELLIDRGYRVAVGDSPAIGSAKQAMKANGCWPLLKKLGVNVVEFKGNREILVDDRICRITETLNDVDAMINLPKLKGHGQLYYTGAIKNCFGCVAGKRKVWHHMHLGDRDDGEHFAQMLIDHAVAVAPCLNIMDGVMSLAGRGPIHGTPVHEGFVAVSEDSFAMDNAVLNYLGGELSQDPVLKKWNHSNPEHTKRIQLERIGPLKRGDFFFPSDDQRKPISFRPWVLARLAWRSWRTKLSS